MTAGRTLLRDLTTHQNGVVPSILESADLQLPSIKEYASRITASKRLELIHATPEFRFSENDQTDPVGQFRWQGSGGSYTLYKALTALWATQEIIVQHDVTNKVTYLNAITAADWYVRIQGGNILTTGGFLDLGATSGFYTGNGAGGSPIRMRFGSNAATPDIDITDARLDLNGNVLIGVGTFRGQGNADLPIRSQRAATDAAAYRIALYMLDPATDIEYIVAQAVPKAATPLFTTLAPNYTPTTSEVDATHLTYTVTAALHLIANFNSAGAMKTLDLGVLA